MVTTLTRYSMLKYILPLLVACSALAQGNRIGINPRVPGPVIISTPSSGGTGSSIGSIGVSDFTSTNVIIPAGSVYPIDMGTLPHGLNTNPPIVNVYLLCTTTDLGYPEGYKISAEAVTSGGGAQVLQYRVNATNIVFSLSDEPYIREANTASISTITRASWRVVAYLAVPAGSISSSGGNADTATIATNLYGNALVRNSYYVDQSFGDDTNDGSSGAPWESITKAQQSALTGSTIFVSSGTYAEVLYRGGVTWWLSRGCRLVGTNVLNPTLALFADTNYVILGEGEIINSSGGPVIESGDGSTWWNPSLDLQCRYIFGSVGVAFWLVNNGTHVSIRFRDCLVSGSFSFSDSSVGGGALIEFENITVYTTGDCTSSDWPYTVVSSRASSTQSADAMRIGTWLINTNITSALP